ncbi:MAG: hypothetical protein JST16_05975 [Bdellovibrionales bacterium]|nr:hypothetical protein [Bdellovibrionales bacterium]
MQKQPHLFLRTAAQYTLDGIQHYGMRDVPIRAHSEHRYRIFDGTQADRSRPVVGHEAAQQSLVQILTGFSRAGRADKLIMLHGPNGSAKSSMIRSLFEGLEVYSQTDEGSLFTFSWVFPNEMPEKTGLGFAAGAKRETGAPLPSESFAKLESEKIGAVVRSELHESPLCFIPVEDRPALFAAWIKQARTPEERAKFERVRDNFLHAELGHKNALIYDALLNESKGDLKKVLRHVRVERYYLSKRLRKSLVTIEPQFSVDAALRQVTLDRSLASLPPALQSLNLFQLEGDLVDGNRGIVEYNDLLKRPPEHFKYLLGTCETGTVTLGHVLAALDTVFIATSNDRHLEAFREHPDYNSFKARMEFIRVPYLLRSSDEEKIYLETAQQAAGTKEIMPHTTKALALWAVLTRLKRPIIKNKPGSLTRILEGLTPLAKAKLYDNGDLPTNLNDEERRELRGHIEELVEEQQNLPYYEGLMGASARELKVAVQLAAQNDQFPTLGPNAIFAELRKLVNRPMDYEYLRIEPNQGFHDYEAFIGVVHREWLDWVDREMIACLNLQREVQIKDFLTKYMQYVTHFVKNEKVRNRLTGQSEHADETTLQEFEGYCGVEGNAEDFRRNLISRLGAWSIENPSREAGKAPPYEDIFPDLIRKLQEKFRTEDTVKIKIMGSAILDVNNFDSALGAKDESTLGEGQALAVRAYRGLQEKFGYGPVGAKEALVSLIRDRYL